jgi:sigma-B regulation protein RsbU (phosphoserine phosphatase)
LQLLNPTLANGDRHVKKISLHGFGLFSDVEGRQEVAAGEVIFKPGDYADKMYLIIKGELRLTRGENEIDVMEAGELVGEMGMVENRPRNGTLTAVTDSVLLPIDRLQFAALVRQHPGFATRVMAIISARLSRRTESEVMRQSFQRELSIGRKMQRSLLPQKMPQIPGWDFAAYYDTAWQVGGDFYDFIPLDEEDSGPSQIWMVIADVTGKGVPAALYMAVARTLIRAETGKGKSPGQVLHRVNELILSDNRSPLFLSVLLAMLDVQTGAITYASAGHNPPLCYRRSTGEVEELPVHGYLLGAFAGVFFSEEHAFLEPGDTLILYTDGVSEARDEQGSFFGIERLKSAVAAAGECPVEQMVQALVTAVSEFTGAIPQADDMTIVAVQRAQAWTNLGDNAY